MDRSVSNSQFPRTRNFDLIKDSMLQSSDLPLAEVLDSNQWEDIFAAHEIDFGNDEAAIYTPAITLWALISQVFFKGEMRSCKAAVGRIASLWATLGKLICSTNTGAYCRARAKISWRAVRAIACRIAANAESMYDAQRIRSHPHIKAHFLGGTLSFPFSFQRTDSVSGTFLLSHPPIANPNLCQPSK